MDETFNIQELLEAARTLEKYLWGKQNDKWGLEEWKRMLRKRISKIELIDTTIPHWEVEMRKRLIQLGSVSIACMSAMDGGKLIQDRKTKDNPPNFDPASPVGQKQLDLGDDIPEHVTMASLKRRVVHSIGETPATKPKCAHCNGTGIIGIESLPCSCVRPDLYPNMLKAETPASAFGYNKDGKPVVIETPAPRRNRTYEDKANELPAQKPAKIECTCSYASPPSETCLVHGIGGTNSYFKNKDSE